MKRRHPSEFATLVRPLTTPHASEGDEYVLGERFGQGFVAVSRTGDPAFILALDELRGTAAGRRGAGCALIAHPSLTFAHDGRRWDAPGAALVCTDRALADSFGVLATDVASRATGTWSSVVAIVEEWQALLTPRGQVTPERELGLWGELWLLSAAKHVDALAASWRGPDGDPTDYFLDGIAAEIKTTRQRRAHQISLSQVDEPVGGHESFVLSLPVSIDPVRGRTVPDLVDGILARLGDPCDGLRKVARSGYVPADREHYPTRFVLLSEPEWYATGDVPRVRAVDPGVSQLRYRVALDPSMRLMGVDATRLWKHFLGVDYRGEKE